MHNSQYRGMSACPRLNRAQEPEGNRPNQVAANNGGQGRGNQGNQARGRAFMLGAEEARQDPNIVTGLEPSDLGFRYEIEIASGKLVEIDKVIKGYKLEIEGHVFNIDLIPFGHGSFDVIIVRIPLPDGKVLRVVRERPKEKARLLMSAKASDKKQEEIVVVRDFPEVFLDDLSGLSPIREIEFQIELIPGATPVAKSPYRLTPSKMEELSGQLKELQDKVKPKRVRAINMTLQSSIKDKILSAQKEAVDESAGLQKGLDEMIKQRNDGTLYYLDRIWVPLKGEVRTLIMDEAHKLKYSVYPGADKMYYDLRKRYWWPGMKKDIVEYVSKCLTCLKVKAEQPV
ncbi:putative reverse transcriptase domain-containing protein [Tanacetum coccineum]